MSMPPAAVQDPSAHNIIHTAQSPIAVVLHSCQRIAQSEATVLLNGETGTGKEVFARYIHVSSPRGKSGPFVPVNCGAIPENLLESEFFGYVKGAFTGAASARMGRIAAAECGTLFLDEIGELPLSMQVKLLRVLQERTYEPVGSNASKTANFRLIAATNRDLALEVQAGRFRQDLYYRLFVCPIMLPPLRERPGDIVELFNHFWEKKGEKRKITPEAMQALASYNWPGNIRELENLVERLSVCTVGNEITYQDLPPPVGTAGMANVEPIFSAIPSVWNTPAPSIPTAPAVSVPATPEPNPVPTSGNSPGAPAPVAAVPPTAFSTPPTPATNEPTQDAFASSVLASAFAPDAPIHETNASATSTVTQPITANDFVATHDLPLEVPSLLADLEAAFIEKALAETDGNKKAAAELLGLQRTTLVEKLRRREKAKGNV
ncbi:MAG: sigma-54-dependent Fis family transcriptional regulator [Myxococcales bacterium]|nr:sigma-54-dependent Fis family transcriptional regulator [Myxococcales bacterium]